MRPRRPRSALLPHGSLAAALLRISITLGLLSALIAALFASLERLDVRELAASSAAVVTQPLSSAQRLDLTVAPSTSHALQLSVGPAFKARLTASRSGDLQLNARPSPAGERHWTLSRTSQGLPVLIQLDAQSGLPGTLTLNVPSRIGLALTLNRSADETDLDLKDVRLERLNVTASGGQLRIMLPLRGQPHIALGGAGGDAALTLPSGTAHVKLDARLSGGTLTLRVPPGAQVQLDVLDNAADPLTAVAPGFEQTTLPDRRTRRYTRPGRSGEPQLSATLHLTDTSLTIQGDSP